MERPIKRNLVVLFSLFFLAVVLSITNGAVNIAFPELLRQDNRQILNLRLLRIAAAVLAGSGLAVSGIALQAILRNPLAEPYLLGTSSGAGLASVSAAILGISRVFMPLAAFLGALISIIVVYGLSREQGKVTEKSLILSGVIIAVALSSVIVFLVSLFGNEALHEMNWWLWGSLQVYDLKLLFIVSIPVLAGIASIYLFAQDLNAISLGEEDAIHLGINPQKTRKLIILLTALITASIVCVCGIIGFVGLIVPHMMRFVVGPNHRILIPAAIIASSLFMMLCDLLSRSLFGPIEIPIGVITAIIGAPVFVLLLKKRRRI